MESEEFKKEISQNPEQGNLKYLRAYICENLKHGTTTMRNVPEHLWHANNLEIVRKEMKECGYTMAYSIDEDFGEEIVVFKNDS